MIETKRHHSRGTCLSKAEIVLSFVPSVQNPLFLQDQSSKQS